MAKSDRPRQPLRRSIQINAGDRIAQLRIVQRIEATYEEVETIAEAPKNTSGFGSTGA